MKLALEIPKFRTALPTLIASLGDSRLICSVDAKLSSNKSDESSFLPLTVDFQEQSYAAGILPANKFEKKERRVSEHLILLSRTIDRSIRPNITDTRSFEELLMNFQVASYDPTHSVSALKCLAINSSASLLNLAGVSCKQFAAGYLENELHVIAAGDKDSLSMIEGHTNTNSVTNDQVLSDLAKIQEGFDEIFVIQNNFLLKDTSFDDGSDPLTRLDVPNTVTKKAKAMIKAGASTSTKNDRAILMTRYLNDCDTSETVLRAALKTAMQTTGRPDGRKVDELRPIAAEVSFTPNSDGSALFTRGQSQVLAFVTIGTLFEGRVPLTNLKDEEELYADKNTKEFFVDYNFPSYAVNKTGQLFAPPRRSVGHGNLVERALAPMVKIASMSEEVALACRVQCEVLSSDGSTSMASVCAASLAIQNAGIELKEPVAGIAIGMNKNILVDILGMEDFYGDMDFKVAGPRSGVTAFQMDVKKKGVSVKDIGKCLKKAHIARKQIIDKMEESVGDKKGVLRVEIEEVKVRNMGKFYGKGGMQLRAIEEASNTKFIVNEERVFVMYREEDDLDRAKYRIHQNQK